MGDPKETSGSAAARYEAEAQAMRAKTARLRELRLARDAAEGKGAAAPQRAAAKKISKDKKKPVPLSDFLDSEERSGRRG